MNDVINFHLLPSQIRLLGDSTIAHVSPQSPKIPNFLPPLNPVSIACYALAHTYLHTKFQKNKPCLHNLDQIQICFVFMLKQLASEKNSKFFVY
jgi:hypothetical protein